MLKSTAKNIEPDYSMCKQNLLSDKWPGYKEGREVVCFIRSGSSGRWCMGQNSWCRMFEFIGKEMLFGGRAEHVEVCLDKDASCQGRGMGIQEI